METLEFGKTSKDELLKKKGNPIETHKANPKTTRETLTYEDNTQYQVEYGIVDAQFKDPEGDEAFLNYWTDKWNAQGLGWQVTDITTGHVQDTQQYRVLSTGEGIVYNKATKRVERVFKFKKDIK